MKYRFILGALVISVLVISAVAQNDGQQSASSDNVMATFPSDTSTFIPGLPSGSDWHSALRGCHCYCGVSFLLEIVFRLA